MAERHPELVREAEFLLNEGGTIRADEAGHVEYVGVGTTEKSPFWLDLTARGTAGHGSRPTPDKPVHRLGRALNRIAEWRAPPLLAPAARRPFAGLAADERRSTLRPRVSDNPAALPRPARPPRLHPHS